MGNKGNGQDLTYLKEMFIGWQLAGSLWQITVHFCAIIFFIIGINANYVGIGICVKV
jgi:hypothetical protein